MRCRKISPEYGKLGKSANIRFAANCAENAF